MSSQMNCIKFAFEVYKEYDKKHKCSQCTSKLYVTYNKFRKEYINQKSYSNGLVVKRKSRNKDANIRKYYIN